MYRTHFALREMPFGIPPDTSFAYACNTHQEALNTLTPRDREILLLWDAGLSYPEIAAQTGLAVGAVGTTLARARRRLVDAHDRQQIRTGTDAAHS